MPLIPRKKIPLKGLVWIVDICDASVFLHLLAVLLDLLFDLGRFVFIQPLCYLVPDLELGLFWGLAVGYSLNVVLPRVVNRFLEPIGLKFIQVCLPRVDELWGR